MTATRTLLFCVLLLPALSGCLDPSGKVKESPPATTSPASASNQTHQRPIADFYVSDTVGYTDRALVFDAENSVDTAPGGQLSYAWTFGDGATASEIRVNHSYHKSGEYRIQLTVTSSVSGLTDSAALNVTILDASALRQPLEFDDSDDDAATPYTEILDGNIFTDAGILRVGIDLGDLPPHPELLSAVLYDFYINGKRYEVYGMAGELAVWDFARDRQLDEARVSISTQDKALLVTVPLSALSGAAFPLRVYWETMLGEPNQVHGAVGDDRAPDEGEISYSG